MENFISTSVFILPGLMAYFWLQTFGLNPPVKHTAPEITGIAALLWLPISYVTLACINAWANLYGDYSESMRVHAAWTLDEIKTVTSDINYVVLFIFVSAIISFVMCGLWSLFLINKVNWLINKIRVWRGLAKLSPTATVWEEFFVRVNTDDTNEEKNEKINKKEKVAVLQICKIDNEDDFIIGSMIKGARPYEMEKALVLADTEEWKDRLDYYTFPVKRVYVDLKAGIIVKELDHLNPTLNETKKKRKKQKKK